MRGDPVDRILTLATSREPMLGDGRLICIDGFAGAGKTTLAASLAAASGATVVHLDDIYPGWGGLFAVADLVAPLLRSLASGETGTYPSWDWASDSPGPRVEVEPAPLVVLEGVGAGQRAWADLTTVLVWVDADKETRTSRGMARDGEQVREHWLRWQQDEALLLEREQTDERADLQIQN